MKPLMGFYKTKLIPSASSSSVPALVQQCLGSFQIIVIVLNYLLSWLWGYILLLSGVSSGSTWFGVSWLVPALAACQLSTFTAVLSFWLPSWTSISSTQTTFAPFISSS